MLSIDWIRKRVEAYRHGGQLGGYHTSQWRQGPHLPFSFCSTLVHSTLDPAGIQENNEWGYDNIPIRN